MTTVKLFYVNKRLKEVEAKGHSDYAEAGSDIVCAAISTLLQTAVLALRQVAGAKLTKKQKDGYLRFKILSEDEDTTAKSDIILQSMVIGLKDICKGYPAYIKMEETHNVY